MTPAFLRFVYQQSIGIAIGRFSNCFVVIGPIGSDEEGPSPISSAPGSPTIAETKVQTTDRASSPFGSEHGKRSPAHTQDRGTDPIEIPAKSPIRKPTRSTSRSPPRSTAKGSKASLPGAGRRVLDGRIYKTWPAKTKFTSPRGLANLGIGYFCYRNNCLPNKAKVEKGRKLPYERTLRAVQHLWGEYWFPDSGTRLDLAERLKQTTAALNAAVLQDIPAGHTLEEDFKTEDQSDPFDFQHFVLDCLGSGAAGYVNSSEALTSEELFDISLERSWTCSDCGHVTTCDESAGEAGHGVGLQVNLQQPRRGLSLVEYLRSNIFQETLTIRCTDGKCKQGKDDKSKPRQQRKAITKTSEILVVRLVRFAQQDMLPKGKKGKVTMVKIADRCAFEEYLNLEEFTADGEPLMYRLDGVVAHRGKFEGTGHYIAAVRKPDGKSFCSINDDRAIERGRGGTVQELERPLSMGAEFDPYVLVYSKV